MSALKIFFALVTPSEKLMESARHRLTNVQLDELDRFRPVLPPTTLRTDGGFHSGLPSPRVHLPTQFNYPQNRKLKSTAPVDPQAFLGVGAEWVFLILLLR